MWLLNEFRVVSSFVHSKVWTQTQWKVSTHTDSNICPGTVTAGNQVIIRLHLRRLAPRDPLTQCPAECAEFSCLKLVPITHSGSLSPWGWYSVSGKRRIISRPTSMDRLTNQPLLWLMSWATILLHHVKISLFLCLFLFHPVFILPNPKWLGVNKCRERSTQTGNRGVFVQHVVGEHLPCQKKETVVLMLLEQLPTRMTKLRLKPFSPLLDSHKCWEIVLLLRHTSDVCGINTNANNRVCKPTV